MPYTIKAVAEVLTSVTKLAHPNVMVEHLLIDSRRLVNAPTTLFFALKSERRNGEDYVEELNAAGVLNFVVSDQFDTSLFPNANFLIVDDSLIALQKLAAYHRRQFHIPVIGITGSNGKTIVKEWLYQLLQEDFDIVRSPKSYNSQIGVPLSVWQMDSNHTLAIFEAGISEKNEMEALTEIIQPTIGVLTNVRVAHATGFDSKAEKFHEKWKLFSTADTVICSNLDPVIRPFIDAHPAQDLFVWGDSHADLFVTDISKVDSNTGITALFQGRSITIAVPFTDNAAIENVITCLSVLLFLEVPDAVIASRILQLQSVEMRLQLKKAINNCYLINDSYSNDLSSLRMALEFLHQQAGNQSATVILSDFGDLHAGDEQYQKAVQSLLQHKVQKFVGIGPRLHKLQGLFHAIPATFFYPTVDAFVSHYPRSKFRDEVILLKGARSFRFERIDLLFEHKVHQTVMEVNLTAMVHNLKEYQRIIKPETRLMAMVKAFSYGSGSAEVASLLQFHKVDYLAVAYADEGVELRKAGIHLPIMVMNPEIVTFQSIVEFNLEPELYSFAILKAFSAFLVHEGTRRFPVHIKIDTGMHRLGFSPSDLPELCIFLAGQHTFTIRSVFSHLVGSENAVHDAFTRQQAQQFLHGCQLIGAAVQYPFIRHIANSAAIFRHPGLQLDMVRLGIGLYGIDSSAEGKLSLQPVATLRTTIAQVRQLQPGDTVGYGRTGVVQRASVIATIRIGYADGFRRQLSNGVGKVFIHGKLAPVIGNVAMDMTMIDITGIDGVAEGDTVEVFGANLSVSEVAKWCNTISYEILTGISQRVRREYFEE